MAVLFIIILLYTDIYLHLFHSLPSPFSLFSIFLPLFPPLLTDFHNAELSATLEKDT